MTIRANFEQQLFRSTNLKIKTVKSQELSRLKQFKVSEITFLYKNLFFGNCVLYLHAKQDLTMTYVLHTIYQNQREEKMKKSRKHT